MKFQSASATTRRDAMRNRQRLQRIGAPTLRTCFPGLDSMQLDFGFSDASEFVPSSQVTVYHPPAPAYFCFACPYSDCDGEFNLSSQVDSAMSSRAPSSSGQIHCTGKRHRDVACTLCLDYSISPKRR